MLLDLGSKPEHHAHCYAVDSYLGSMLTQYGTGSGIPLCHGCPLWDNRAVRIRCLWWRASFCPGFRCFYKYNCKCSTHFLILQMLLCRVCSVQCIFPLLLLCLHVCLSAVLRFTLPTPTSPTSVREGCACYFHSLRVSVFTSLSTFFA